MGVVANVLVGLIGVFHVYVLVLEMFLWTTPYGMKAFRNSKEKAALTAVLAKNQGLYNGFLSAGLFWGLARPDWGVQVFFVSCVLVAGLYGYATTKSKVILMSQGGVAAVTLAALLYSR